jgi:hypothetical protein
MAHAVGGVQGRWRTINLVCQEVIAIYMCPPVQRRQRHRPATVTREEQTSRPVVTVTFGNNGLLCTLPDASLVNLALSLRRVKSAQAGHFVALTHVPRRKIN